MSVSIQRQLFILKLHKHMYSYGCNCKKNRIFNVCERKCVDCSETIYGCPHLIRCSTCAMKILEKDGKIKDLQYLYS